MGKSCGRWLFYTTDLLIRNEDLYEKFSMFEMASKTCDLWSGIHRDVGGFYFWNLILGLKSVKVVWTREPNTYLWFG